MSLLIISHKIGIKSFINENRVLHPILFILQELSDKTLKVGDMSCFKLVSGAYFMVKSKKEYKKASGKFMISSPQNSSFEKKSEKLSLPWWQRIKALIQWLKTKKDPIDKNLQRSFSDPIASKEILNEWIQAIDILLFLVHSIRKNLELRSTFEIDFEISGATTYVFHIDRILVKTREHFYHIRACEQYKDHYVANKLEFNQVSKLGEQCYQTILQLTTLIQGLPIKKLYSDEFINKVHTLELDAIALGSVIRSFNQNIYKEQAILQMVSLEQDLLRSLEQTRYSFNGPAFANSGLEHTMMYANDGFLRTKLQQVSDEQSALLIKGIIDLHEMLKRSYVVVRKSVIKDSLDKMAKHIESLINAVSNELNQKQAYYHLNQIFHCIETIRFSANRESRYSKNLFDKAKIAYFQLRKLCQKNPLGNEYLKAYSIKRVTLMKPRS